VFRNLNSTLKHTPLDARAAAALVTLADGRIRREEFGRGAGFLSQTARLLLTGSNVKIVEVTDAKGRLILRLP